MSSRKFSECVSPGHPDKCADYISEYILDRYLEKDPNTRYAVEVMIKGYNVYLAGEVTSTAQFTDYDYLQFVISALYEIGYTAEYFGKWGKGNVINPLLVKVVSHISAQSPEIGQGVDNEGFGDQGIFFGYADPNGDEYMMPKSHSLAKNLCHMLYTQAKEKGIGGIDIKTEILLDERGNMEKIIAAVPCHGEEEYNLIYNSIRNWYNEKEVDLPFYPDIILNGTGNYVMHGPIADCGVTGRKLAVDFYGGECKIGGGSVFSKDGTKSDVSLNLYARELAVKYATEEKQPVMVSLACCIGKNTIDYTVDNPCGENISTGTLSITPKELINKYDLNKPIFTSICNFGLFGEFQKDKRWENL